MRTPSRRRRLPFLPPLEGRSASWPAVAKIGGENALAQQKINGRQTRLAPTRARRALATTRRFRAIGTFEPGLRRFGRALAIAAHHPGDEASATS
jgi:hypothetical protein